MKTYTITYPFGGKVFIEHISAENEDDLRSRLLTLADAKIDGVLWDPPKRNGHDWSSDA